MARKAYPRTKMFKVVSAETGRKVLNVNFTNINAAKTAATDYDTKHGASVKVENVFVRDFAAFPRVPNVRTLRKAAK